MSIEWAKALDHLLDGIVGDDSVAVQAALDYLNDLNTNRPVSQDEQLLTLELRLLLHDRTNNNAATLMGQIQE